MVCRGGSGIYRGLAFVEHLLSSIYRQRFRRRRLSCLIRELKCDGNRIMVLFYHKCDDGEGMLLAVLCFEC